MNPATLGRASSGRIGSRGRRRHCRLCAVALTGVTHTGRAQGRRRLERHGRHPREAPSPAVVAPIQARSSSGGSRVESHPAAPEVAGGAGSASLEAVGKVKGKPAGAGMAAGGSGGGLGGRLQGGAARVSGVVPAREDFGIHGPTPSPPLILGHRLLKSSV